MSTDDFDRVIMEKLDRLPFQAFTIEMLDGKRLEIDRPFSVAIRGGVASCFAGGKLHLEIRSEQVRQVGDMANSLSSSRG